MIVLEMLVYLCIVISLVKLIRGDVWTVTVKTGNEQFSGTDSNVYIKLFNENGRPSAEHQLSHHNLKSKQNNFLIPNLFEMGAINRFLIETEDMKDITEIQVRHDSFLPFQSDWLLESVSLQRHRDGVVFKFPCNCWLRKNHPYITIFKPQDSRSSDKNKSDRSSSKQKRTFVIILLVLISLVISLFCYHNQNARRLRRQEECATVNETSEHTGEELSSYHAAQNQSPTNASRPSTNQPYSDIFRRWKNSRNSRTAQSHLQESASGSIPAQLTLLPDAPPSYEDLYPNSNRSDTRP